MFGRPIDNGFYEISEAQARQLCGTLPGNGREKLVALDGRHYWIARTGHNRKQVWSIRDAGNWKLVDGRAVLGR